MDPEERERQQLASFFEKRDSEKKRASKTKAKSSSFQKSAIATIAEEDSVHGLEDGTMDWRGFRKLVTETPGLEDLVPSVLGPVLDKTGQAHDRKHVFGWMGVEEFERKCADKTWSL